MAPWRESMSATPHTQSQAYGSGHAFLEWAAEQNNSSVMDLETFLNTSSQGQIILSTYKQLNKLDNGSRQKLTDLVVRREMDNYPDHRISTRRFLLLTQEIVRIFPKENPQTYYVPFATLPDGTRRRTRGKLWDRYNNIRRDLRTAGLLQPIGLQSYLPE